jgi:hypothetical protein
VISRICTHRGVELAEHGKRVCRRLCVAPRRRNEREREQDKGGALHVLYSTKVLEVVKVLEVLEGCSHPEHLEHLDYLEH